MQWTDKAREAGQDTLRMIERSRLIAMLSLALIVAAFVVTHEWSLIPGAVALVAFDFVSWAILKSHGLVD